MVSDENDSTDIFVRDLRSATTERANVSISDAEAEGGGAAPAIDGSGRYIGFQSTAANLVAGDTNGRQDVFIRDRPPPVVGKSVGAVPESGTVLYSLPRGARLAASVPGLKGRRFVALREARTLPVGTLLDTRKGRIRVTSATGRADATQSGSCLLYTSPSPRD